MIRTLSLLIFLNLSGFCLGQVQCDLPPEWRHSNYAGGSCAHASTESALESNGEHAKAAWWRQTFAHGEYENRHLQRLKNAGIKYMATFDGDEQLLIWAMENRRMVIVYWPTMHVTNLVGRVLGKDGQYYAVILDNNHTKRYDTYLWSDWVKRWRRCSGVAFVIMSGEARPPVPKPMGS
mgnify:FL=1